MAKQERNEIERYGCTFSYLTTRAVHIEVASDLSIDAFIIVLRRFIVRSQLDEIFSGNGTDVVGAECILRESLQSLKQSKFNNFCFQLEMKWRFKPPFTSHMGGAWKNDTLSAKNFKRFNSDARN